MSKNRKTDPTGHKGMVSWSREPLTLKVWSYDNPKSVDYYVAFIDAKTHTLCSGKFRVKR